MISIASLSRLPATLALVALVAIPLAANPFSARVFDPERAVLLRLLALPALFLLLATTTKLRRPNAIEWGAWLYGAGSLLSCFVSVAPAQAFAGDYARQMGLLTDLALLGVFFAIRRARDNESLVDLAWRTAIFGGAALGALAAIEALSGAGRASSIAGGPTFLGSHLALLLPLAISRLRNRLDFACATSIGVGMLASGSRVATIAGVVGTLVVALHRGGDFAKRISLGAGVVAAILAVLALPPIASRLPERSLPVRIGELFERHGNDLEQRGLLWRDAGRALAAKPESLLLGHGPDSIGVAFSPDVSEELQRRIGGRHRVDRFHSDLLDLLFTRGAIGLVGMIVLVIASMRAARRDAGADPSRIGWFGLLAAATVDSLLSVPGITSRLLVFAAAGTLAVEFGRAPSPNTTLPRTPPPDGTDRALFASTAALSLLFAVDYDERWPVCLAAILIVGRSWSSLLVAGVVLVLGSVARAVCVIASNPSPPSNTAGEALWLGLAALVLPCALAMIAGWLALLEVRRRRADSDGSAPIRPVFAIAVVLCIVASATAIRDDVNRILAESFARIASRLQHVAGRPQAAVHLLDRAAALAPEVARYSMRAAIAETDALDAVPPDSKPTLDATFVSVSERVHACSLRAPRDAYLLAEGADVLLRVAERAKPQRALLVAHALRLARPALANAPTALPVLQANARLDLAIGDPDAALAHLSRALSIDNTTGLTHLLLGRVHAAKLDAQQAAYAYSFALPTGIGKLEALAGLALAAASIDGIEEAARLVLEMTRVQPLPKDVRAAVEGARPLLRLVAWDRWDAVFSGAEANFAGDPGVLVAVRSALDY